MTTTKSPVSTCGVKMAFSLPRSNLAAFTATWPSTWPLASIIHHLRGTSLALAEKVFIRAEKARKLRAMPQSVKFSLEMRFVQLVFFCALAICGGSAKEDEGVSAGTVIREINIAQKESPSLRDICSRIAFALRWRLRRSSRRNEMADERRIERR